VRLVYAHLDATGGAVMAATPLTREDLDRQSCARPGCAHWNHGDGLVLSGVCHPSAGFDVDYLAGVLTFRCVRCTKVVTQIKVAAC
jgi:hypothetical protein